MQTTKEDIHASFIRHYPAYRMVLHIIKKNLEADKQDLKDNNNEFDECLHD